MKQRISIRPEVPARIVVCLVALATAGCGHHKKEPAEDLPSLEVLTEQAKSKDKDDRYNAVDQLRLHAPDHKEAVPLLIAALSDKDPDIRWVATKGLERFGSAAEEATPKLMEALRDPNPTVREGAARALSTMGVAGLRALSALSVAENDPNEDVRREAKRAVNTLRQVQKYQSAKNSSAN